LIAFLAAMPRARLAYRFPGRVAAFFFLPAEPVKSFV
jgi:hypothetical protein